MLDTRRNDEQKQITQTTPVKRGRIKDYGNIPAVSPPAKSSSISDLVQKSPNNIILKINHSNLNRIDVSIVECQAHTPVKRLKKMVKIKDIVNNSPSSKKDTIDDDIEIIEAVHPGQLQVFDLHQNSPNRNEYSRLNTPKVKVVVSNSPLTNSPFAELKHIMAIPNISNPSTPIKHSISGEVQHQKEISRYAIDIINSLNKRLNGEIGADPFESPIRTPVKFVCNSDEKKRKTKQVEETVTTVPEKKSIASFVRNTLGAAPTAITPLSKILTPIELEEPEVVETIVFNNFEKPTEFNPAFPSLPQSGTIVLENKTQHSIPKLDVTMVQASPIQDFIFNGKMAIPRLPGIPYQIPGSLKPQVAKKKYDRKTRKIKDFI